MNRSSSSLQIDSWNWGNEIIIWGFDPSHKYTFKILEPKRGREGCLSLQYHHVKSESWLLLRGTAWALVAFDDKVCTRILRPGDIQNLGAGTIHRLMGVSDDVRVAEPSTPDAHAADKTAVKDVVRLHCVFGRPVTAARDEKERRLIERCIKVTEDAISQIEKGKVPEELNRELLNFHGAYSLP